MRHVALPHCDDPCYQLTGAAGLRALVQLTTRPRVSVSIEGARPDLLELSVGLALPTTAAPDHRPRLRAGGSGR